ncbi:MAG: hypothetical protein HY828_02810 [Actinobacteria bacterium]|nr:hypothetical protein [Actinomycetota bacterium]
MHVRFESLVADEFGLVEVRRMVSAAKLRRSRPQDPATPLAWASAAAGRVAAGHRPGDVVAELGDLGVFCVALGSFALLATVPVEIRSEACTALRIQPEWLADAATTVDLGRLDSIRDRLETAHPTPLRMWTVALLPLVVEAFARQAPRWWRVRRRRFARMVRHRLATPES